jgi:hypothetical protein
MYGSWSAPAAITTTDSWVCPGCLQNTSDITHVCETQIEHDARMFHLALTRVAAEVQAQVTQDCANLAADEILFLNTWLSKHTNCVANSIANVETWLKGLPLEAMVREAMILSAEICWIKIRYRSIHEEIDPIVP